VAGLLKLYLRELPEPLLTYESFDNFIAANESMFRFVFFFFPIRIFFLIKKTYLKKTYSNVSSVQDKALKQERMRALIAQIPIINRNVLQYLLAFLHRVSSRSHINKMSSSNLALIFGPNLLRPKAETAEALVQQTPKINQILEFLIEEQASLFPEPSTHPPSKAHIGKSSSNAAIGALAAVVFTGEKVKLHPAQKAHISVPPGTQAPSENQPKPHLSTPPTHSSPISEHARESSNPIPQAPGMCSTFFDVFHSFGNL
jgi:hypothetical protein